MDFTIDRADLLSVIDKCALAVPDSKHVTPAFRVMLVDASKKDSVRFAASGEYCSVDTVALAQIKSSGRFVAIPNHLRDLVSAMPPGRMQFTMKGSRITVKSQVSSRKSSFENHTIEVNPVEDPGKDAPWQTLDAQELARALRLTKPAATWIGSSEPVASLLIPTPRGVDVFGCNMYLLTVVESPLKLTGEPIIMPAAAASIQALMAPDDANVNIVSDGRRVYLENCDTLVSAQLFEYKFLQTHQMMAGLFKENITRGPRLKTEQLIQSVKSLHGLNSFAGEKERHDFGFQIHCVFGQSIVVELDLAAASGRDEFDIVNGADDDFSEFDVYLSAKIFESMLQPLAGYPEVQSALAVHEPTVLLVLRSEGITCGIMTKEKR